MSKTLKLRSGSVDLTHCRVYRHETRVALTTLEAGLLTYLAERPSVEIPRDELLEAVWGHQATVITRAVDNTVTRLRAKVEIDPKAPDHILTVRGVGYRFEPLAADAPPTPPLPRQAAPASALLGRAEALLSLADLFDSGGRPVTITGPGGIGKTCLARAFGAQAVAAGRFPEAVFVDLSGATDALGLLIAVARALGVPQVDDRGDALLPALRGRGAGLIILDNLEQLRDPAARLIGMWLDRVPSLRLLTTSRIRLTLPQEGVLTLGPLEAEAAARLFVQRAQRVRPGYAPGEGEDAVISTLVERLDRLPLAIELAASRVGILGTRELLERLGEGTQLLGRNRSEGDRRETLEGAIRWSWMLLEPPERRALAQAALFQRGFTLAAAEAVLALPGARSPAEAIGALREASLIQATPRPGGRLRYAFLETIRQFAAAQLGPEEAEGAQQRRRAYFVDHGASLAEGIRGPKSAEAALALLDEEANILAASRESLKADAPGDAARLLLSLRSIALTRGPAEPYRRQVNEVLGTTPPEDPLALSLTLFLGELAHILGEHPEASAAFEDAAARARAQGHPARLGEALARLGHLWAFEGRFDEGLPHLEAALAIARAEGEAALEALILDRLGSVYHLMGDLPASRRHLSRALALHRRARDESAATRAASNLGLIDLEEGRIQRAKGRITAAAELDATLGHRRSEALQRLNLGALALEEGDHAGAQGSLREALRLAQGAGDRRTEGLVRIDLTLLFAEAGDLVRARAEGLEAELTFIELEEPFFEGLALAHLGAALALDGDLVGAADAFEGAAARLPPPEAHPTIAGALSLAATLDHARGEGDAALARVAPLREGPHPLSGRSSYVRLILRFLTRVGVLAE